MKKNLRLLMGGFVAIAALALASCAYDPYYGGSASYSSYGYGHGYGGSSFSTTTFVSTGDPRWGYDPYCRSYYDYNRRAYYDPYLYGYYPVGYRPPVIIGAPHPHGWRQGSRYCPPPRRVTNVTLVNYRNRESAYRNSNHSWARQVRQQQAPSRGNFQGRDNRDNRGGWDTRGRDQRDPRASSPFGNRDMRDQRGNPGNRSGGGWNSNNRPGRENIAPPSRGGSIQDRRQPRVPSNYNTPVETRPGQRPDMNRFQNRGNGDRNRGGAERSGGFQRPSPAPSQRGENRGGFERPQRSGGENRGGFQRPQRSGDENRSRGGDRERQSRGGGEGRVRGLGQG